MHVTAPRTNGRRGMHFAAARTSRQHARPSSTHDAAARTSQRLQQDARTCWLHTVRRPFVQLSTGPMPSVRFLDFGRLYPGGGKQWSAPCPILYRLYLDARRPTAPHLALSTLHLALGAWGNERTADAAARTSARPSLLYARAGSRRTDRLHAAQAAARRTADAAARTDSLHEAAARTDILHAARAAARRTNGRRSSTTERPTQHARHSSKHERPTLHARHSGTHARTSQQHARHSSTHGRRSMHVTAARTNGRRSMHVTAASTNGRRSMHVTAARTSRHARTHVTAACTSQQHARTHVTAACTSQHHARTADAACTSQQHARHGSTHVPAARTSQRLQQDARTCWLHPVRRPFVQLSTGPTPSVRFLDLGRLYSGGGKQWSAPCPIDHILTRADRPHRT